MKRGLKVNRICCLHYLAVLRLNEKRIERKHLRGAYATMWRLSLNEKRIESCKYCKLWEPIEMPQ